MVNISPTVQISFMPHGTFRLLSQMYYVALDCLAYYVYFKTIQENRPTRKNNNWLIVTHNAYYDLYVQRWCMLFGQERSEPTHFYHLMSKKYDLASKISQLQITPSTRMGLQNYILSKGKINHHDFHKFKTNTVHYRNKCLIHREHDPNIVHDKWINMPITKKIIKTAFPLYELIVKLAATFPDSKDSKNDYALACRIFENKGELSLFYKKDFLLTK